MKNELSLNIENLVLEGFNRIDKDELQIMIMQSLEQIIVERGLPDHLKLSTSSLELEPVDIEKDSTITQLAQKIAQQIYDNQ